MTDGSDLEVVVWKEEDMSREEVPEMAIVSSCMCKVLHFIPGPRHM